MEVSAELVARFFVVFEGLYATDMQQQYRCIFKLHQIEDLGENVHIPYSVLHSFGGLRVEDIKLGRMKREIHVVFVRYSASLFNLMKMLLFNII